MTENTIVKDLLELSKRVEAHNILVDTTSTIECSIELADDIELPYVFHAEALHPGTFKGFTIEEEEIVRAKDTIFNSEDNIHNYEINKDHKSSRKMDSSVDDLLGRVVASNYDFDRKALILTGHIYNKEIALKMMNRVIKYVSLRINPAQIDDTNGLRFARNLSFEELSLVRAPGDPDARII